MTLIEYDTEAFRNFEHEGWDRVSDGYHNNWKDVTTQIIPTILSAARVSSDTSLLDVACGPGYVLGLAAQKGADVKGVDLSEKMVNLARKNYPEIDVRTGDAEDLPYENSSFDVVAINFGVLHFPNADKALVEAHRVLKPGGRLALTAWSGPEGSAIGFAMDAVAEFGTMDVELPAGPPIFRFASHEECARTVAEIGFVDCNSEDHVLQWTLTAPDALMDSLREATARTSALLGAQKAEDIPAIKAAMTASCEPYTVDGKTTVPLPAVLTIATKDT